MDTRPQEPFRLSLLRHLLHLAVINTPGVSIGRAVAMDSRGYFLIDVYSRSAHAGEFDMGMRHVALSYEVLDAVKTGEDVQALIQNLSLLLAPPKGIAPDMAYVPLPQPPSRAPALDTSDEPLGGNDRTEFVVKMLHEMERNE